MKTLTVTEYIVLKWVINKATIPVNRRNSAALDRLIYLQIIKIEQGSFVPIPEASYTYRGSTYTIK